MEAEEGSGFREVFFRLSECSKNALEFWMLMEPK